MPDLEIPLQDNNDLFNQIEKHGAMRIPDLLTPSEVKSLSAIADSGQRYRSSIDMSQHSFGVGVYKYFSYPLPSAVQALRTSLYERLVGPANDWHRRAGLKASFPASHQEFLADCQEAGQTKPTCLLLSYETGGRNNLHQDNYGKLTFPFQVVVGLTRSEDYEGGEFILLREELNGKVQFASVYKLECGEGLVFPSKWLPPAPSEPANFRPKVKHGVAPIISGERLSLGIVFQDAP